MRADRNSGGYGPLEPRPSENDGVTYLALPAGFVYTAFGKTGEPMSDNNPTPPFHDGMGAFGVNGELRLVRNHEARSPGPAFGLPTTAYDPNAPGGTTTLVIDPETRLPERDFVSLNGTSTNCAGGPTLQGSWLTCEETTFGETQGFTKDHGYVFEVSAAADGPVEPVPFKAMGRFVHEAVAVDPKTGIVYQTEDRDTAGFYRFLPEDRSDLSAGGRLQMLRVKRRRNYNTKTGQKVGKSLPVEWVDIDRPDPPEAEQDSLAVYNQGQERGAATFSRAEGCWYGDGSVFFNCTNGGDQELGQVWEYRPGGRSSGGKLTLLFESKNAEMLDAPDDLTVSPRGGLVICEDGSGDQFLRGLTQRGKIFDFAQNVILQANPGEEGEEIQQSEFAGACFSPDGETLFVNILAPGVTFAIWGPWEEGAL